MAKHGGLLYFCFFSAILFSTRSCGAVEEDRKVYIAYMGSLPGSDYSPITHHMSLLQDVLRDRSFLASHYIRSYERSFNGFAAKLTEQEAERLEGVVSVFPSKTYQLHTTRSWDFIGFPETSARNHGFESDVIVGVIDTGIWPESASFSDEGFDPPPKKWKGACKGSHNFTCNKGCKGLCGSWKSHCLNCGWEHDKGSQFHGFAHGNARGGPPSARIAVYKACFALWCMEADILAAFDDAVADGVDVISISVGSSSVEAFDRDSIAIGAFHAVRKGILTSQSAGNSGPAQTASVAPWLISVAAGSTDRQIIDNVILGDGRTINGRSVNDFTTNGTKFPIVHGSSASSSCTKSKADMCLEGCLDSHLVKGKIVLCHDFIGFNIEAHMAGAVGSIMLNQFDNVSPAVPLPSLGLTTDDYSSVTSFVNSAKEPTANIVRSEEIEDSTAQPTVASFSSRGPNKIALDIMKEGNPNTKDSRQVKYNILAGTSMSCPHVSGVAAYIKSFHPDWSPSAIKSAIMTTARTMNDSKNPEAEFAYGSGQINPVNATDPGLVYEISEGDYVNFPCGIGYSAKRIKVIVGDNSMCQEAGEKFSAKDLNYPAMTASVDAKEPFTIVFNRTVTNVGLVNSTYTAKIFPHVCCDCQL